MKDILTSVIAATVALLLIVTVAHYVAVAINNVANTLAGKEGAS